MKKIISLLLLAAFIFSAVSCASAGSPSVTVPVTTEGAASVPNIDGVIGDRAAGTEEPSSTTAVAYTRMEISAADSLYASESGSYMYGSSGKGTADGYAPSTAYVPDGIITIEPPVTVEPKPDIQPQSGVLTAAEWCDNDNYSFFTGVLNHNDWYEITGLWSLFPTERYAVLVTDGTSPVKGAVVYLLSGDTVLYTAITDRNGHAYLFANTDGSKIQIPDGVRAETTHGTAFSSLTVSDNSGYIELVCNGKTDAAAALDLMFTVDTTGSMGDELEFLKKELQSVISAVKAQYPQTEIRLSVNFYRDHDDEYVVKYFKFNGDIDEAISNIAAQYSNGGGDTPEAVDEALENSVSGHAWSTDNETVKLLFIVLDAPPHSDREGTPERYKKAVLDAAAAGIRIIPVVSSGADTELECLMRSAAAMTGGTYVFLTDDSGIGNSHLEPTIGEYDVELLGDLLIRLIADYCG